ncbi:magnesium or manganese-dependent protein phosphatase [Streptomyces viridochromogenes DSM 40736]|uniref:Magnesium or manganese-dependent protein phosphatase n=1 Tax=Streptomyces viridochromogenes (strain DSM 40736 / JCM 4977 / BCRC 1201 / Tue 494) TaxID=591159 RepID=D9X433_STRVT|nr:magnesium or manganese-dependent protein phosphatase [Streptomyces viridochromogenes DSM 40736]
MAGQVFLLQVVLAVLLVAAAAAALVLQARRDSTREARARTLAVAESVAQSPGIVAAVDGRNPTAALQPRAEAVRKRTGVDYVVLWNTDGIRYTHPDPDMIGKHIVGPYRDTIDLARAGRPLVRTIDTVTGLTVNSSVPITRPDGSLAGISSAGITVRNVNNMVADQLPLLLVSVAGALVLTSGSAVLVSRRLRRQTHGLGAAEMTRMYDHHDAVLHSVREGVVIVEGDGRLLLANDEARRLLGLPDDAEGRPVAGLGLAPSTVELLASARMATDEVHLAGDRLLAVNVRPTDRDGGPAGNVATLRDTTELHALAGRAEKARERLELLYSAGARIGTTLDVVRTAEELAEVAVPRFADFVSVELLDPVLRGEEPAGPSSEMRRTALRGVREDPPLYSVGELVRFAPSTPMAVGMHSGRAVLEADLRAAPGWEAQDPERARRILDYGIRSLIAVPLRARGVVLGAIDFWRMDPSELFGEEDLSFAEELAARSAVCVDNARRYTREHTMSVTLQRSLLPGGLPEQSAVEVAYRYLPAQAGVGGDWFDVIPLSCTRVALVVGDVVGHGLHASATMGRLRTAVHNFSALDLTPDELLTHLDELVARMDQDGAARGGDEGATGATCLYAVYDPVSGHCSMARAGHPGPALIRPGGAVEFPDVPAGLPLGFGGQPFETAELELPEGSRLALYTDGLVEDRHRDSGTGLELLRRALASPADRTMEDTCQAVLDALVPADPSDDIALLMARTRVLAPEQVATWDIPADPAAVAAVRKEATRQVADWGLGEISFAAELILSELVTNAIRYGREPITVRLLLDHTLVCEVADGSSTSPHLRRAKTTDEGGRGLFLVTQFAQRWGTRYSSDGKVIWTEQALDGGEAATGGEALGTGLLDAWDDVSLP